MVRHIIIISGGGGIMRVRSIMRVCSIMGVRSIMRVRSILAVSAMIEGIFRHFQLDIVCLLCLKGGVAEYG